MKRTRGLPALLQSLLLAWLLAACLEYFLLPKSLRALSGLEGIASMSMVRVLLITMALTVVFFLAPMDPKWQRYAMAVIFGLLAVLSLVPSFTWAYLAICLGILAALTIYGRKGWDGSPVPAPASLPERRRYPWIVAAGAVIFFLVVSLWTVSRVLGFATPSYDFGIFAQMFHSMKTGGLPMTTLERDGPLSHFAVHMSPIYYLLLPFYALFPHPATLQVLQAAVLASAVIPLWKLGRLHGLSPRARTLLCFVLLLCPAYAGGTGYDLHENAFLTPLILWLFYGIDRKNSYLTALFALLTSLVKEDAAVYVAVIGLYVLLRSLLQKDIWGRIAGSAVLAGAVGYFLAVTGYLAAAGDGVMTYRYSNFMYDGSGSLVTVIKSVILCPMKAVFECVDPEKLPFIALTLLPLAGLPLLTRRYERYLLLIPYVLVNLMSDYTYQHNIFFQYTYGSIGCLVYLTLVNGADMKKEGRRLAALGLAVAIGAGAFCTTVLPKAVYYPQMCIRHGERDAGLRTALDVIPEDVSVAATTFYTTYLSRRDILYDVKYASLDHILGCEYLALNPGEEATFQRFGGYDRFLTTLREAGYEQIAEYGDICVVFRRT